MAGLLQDTEGYAWAGGLAEGIKSGLLAYTNAQEFAQKKQLQQMQIDMQRQQLEMERETNLFNKEKYKQESEIRRLELDATREKNIFDREGRLLENQYKPWQYAPKGTRPVIDNQGRLTYVTDPTSVEYMSAANDIARRTMDDMVKTGQLEEMKNRGLLGFAKTQAERERDLLKEQMERDKQIANYDLKMNELRIREELGKQPKPLNEEERKKIIAETGKTEAETEQIKKGKLTSGKSPEELAKIQAETDLIRAKTKGELAPKAKSKGKTIPEGGVAQIADLKDQLSNLKNIENSWRNLVGPVQESSGGFLGALFQQKDVISKRAQGLLKNTSVDEYKNLRKQYAQSIGKALEGGKLTDADYERKYIDFVPDVGDSESQAIGKLNNLRIMMQNKHNNLVTTLGSAGYDTENLSLENQELSRKKVETIDKNTKIINGQKWIKEGAGWRKAK